MSYFTTDILRAIGEIEQLSAELKGVNEDTCPAVRQACRHSGLLDLFSDKYERQRIEAFLAERIYHDLTYRELGNRIFEMAKAVCGLQRQRQQSMRQDAPFFYENIDKIVGALEGCLLQYRNILPKAWQYVMTLADGTETEIGRYYETLVNGEIIKMDIPEQYRYIIKNVRKNQSVFSGISEQTQH